MIGIPPLCDLESNEINSAMMASWLPYCIAFTGALSLMAEWKKDARFPDRREYRETLHLLSVEMAKSHDIAVKKLGASDLINPNESDKRARRDINDAEIAMKKFIDRLAAKIPNPVS